MKQILLVRHAESTNNALHARLEALAAGDVDFVRTRNDSERASDCELSTLGLDQADLLGAAMALRNPPNPILIASPMRRALQTASAIRSALSLDSSRFLCQGNLFEVGGAHLGSRAVPTTTPAQIEAQFGVTCRGIDPEGWYVGYDGPESLQQATQRVDAVVTWIERFLADPGLDFQTAIIVSHGDLMSRWLRRWMGIPIGRGLAFMHHNTGISSLSWDRANGVLMHGVNDTGHLPDSMRSGDSEGWWNCVLPDLQLTTYDTLKLVPDAVSREMEDLRARHLWSVEPRSSEYLETSTRSVHVVGQSAGRVIGCVQFDPETNRLRQMVVDPRFRRHGVGLRLVRRVENEARRHGRTQLSVHAWEQSRSFYERAGFRPAGEVQSDAVVAWQPMSLGL